MKTLIAVVTALLLVAAFAYGKGMTDARKVPGEGRSMMSPPEPPTGGEAMMADTPPAGASVYYSLAKDARSITLKISDIEGKLVRELEGNSKAGFHRVSWDLRQVRSSSGSSRNRLGGYAPAGKYLVSLIVDEREYKTVLAVEDDPDH